MANNELMLTTETPIRQHRLPPELAADMILAFENRHGLQHTLLACHAAFPLIITPDLVNLIRINFLDGVPIPWYAEADFLLSPVCRPIEHGVYQIDPSARELLLADLLDRCPDGDERLLRLADFLLAYLEQQADRGQRPEMTRAQQWIAWSYLKPEKVVEDMTALLMEPRPGGSQLTTIAHQLEVAMMLEVVREPIESRLPLEEYQQLMQTAQVIAHYWYRDQSVLDRLADQAESSASLPNSLLATVAGGIRQASRDEAAHLARLNLPPLPEPWVNRNVELDTLRQKLVGSTPVSHCLVVGTPGIGKTALVAHLAHDETIRVRFPDGVIWLKLGLASDIPHILAQIISFFGENVSVKKVDELAAVARMLLSRHQCLLIVDDAMTVADIEQLWNVLSYRPYSVGITREPAQDIGDFYFIIRLLPLTLKDASELLARLAPTVRNQALLERLASLSIGLPLALHLLGPVIESASNTETLETLINRLERDRIRTADLAPELFWRWAVLPDELRDAFVSLGVFAPDTFDLSDAASAWHIDSEAARGRLALLHEHGLVEVESARGQFILSIDQTAIALRLHPDISPGEAPWQPVTLTLAQRRRLVEGLLALPSMLDLTHRDIMVGQLPVRIRDFIPRSSIPLVDVTNIVNTCLGYSGGLNALIETMRFFEGNSIAMAQLDQTLKALNLHPGSVSLEDFAKLREELSQIRTPLLHKVPLGQPLTLTTEQVERLIDLLLVCPSITGREQRDAVVKLLPAELRAQIARSSRTFVDVQNIVQTCLMYPGALEALIESVRFFDDGTHQMACVDQMLEELEIRVGIVSLKDFAELTKLSSQLTIESQTLVRLYRASAPSHAEQLDSSALFQIDVLLRKLANFAVQPDGTHPLVAFVEHLVPFASNPDLREELRSWIEQVVRQLGLPPVATETFADNVLESVPRSACLLIRLSPDLYDDHLYYLQAWLMDGGQTLALHADEESRSLEAAKGLIDQLAEEATLPLGVEPYSLTVEFLLPAALLLTPVDAWPVAVGIDHIQVPLSMHFHVVVRVLERIEQTPFKRADWQRKWDLLSSDRARVVFVDSIEAWDAKQLYFRIANEEAVVAVFLNAPPAHTLPAIVSTLAAAGVPAALFFRQPADDTRMRQQAFTDMLADRRLSDLKDLVFDARRHSTFIGETTDITLLWDNPNRLPPDSEFFVPPSRED